MRKVEKSFWVTLSFLFFLNPQVLAIEPVREGEAGACGRAGNRCCAGANLCEPGLFPSEQRYSPTCTCRTRPPQAFPTVIATNIFCPEGGINTALGCVNVSSIQNLVDWFFKNFLGIGGGIALILMIMGSLKIIISGGDPEKVKEGKSLITSAISGLLFMIFSLFLLRFIGVDVLHLPGLEK